jgi:hypothetical protein
MHDIHRSAACSAAGAHSRVGTVLTLLRDTIYLARQDMRAGRPKGRAGRLYRLVAYLFHESRRVVLRVGSVVLVSHPKSGRTWLRYMLDQLGIHVEYSHRPAERPLPGGWRGKRLILLHRDPRDAAISYWFQLTKRDRVFSGTLSDFLRDPELGLESLIRFNLTWKQEIDRSEVGLILSYEGLHADTAAELGRAVAFITERYPQPARLFEAVAAAGFDAMRALEQSGRGGRLYGVALEPVDPADPETYKTRDGRIGGWRSRFSSADAAYALSLLNRYDYFEAMRGVRGARPGPMAVSARRLVRIRRDRP